MSAIFYKMPRQDKKRVKVGARGLEPVYPCGIRTSQFFIVGARGLEPPNLTDVNRAL